jgi:serine/threonine-protein kinase
MGRTAAPVATAPAASSSAPTATTLADLPLPASSVAEAVTEYNAGIQQLRDDSFVNAYHHFQHAAQLDPTMALAHLRTALVGQGIGGSEDSKRAFATATALRVQLGERDRALLDAIEPLVNRAERNEGDAIARFEAAHERFPLDEEFLALLAYLTLGDAARGPVYARRATELDPRDAGAWELLGRSEALAGHIDAARNALQTCTAVSLESSDCLYWIGSLDAEMGRCEDMESEARREADVDPHFGNWLLLDAALALGRPEAVVRELAARFVATAPPDAQPFEALLYDARVDAYSGRFDRAVRLLNDAERAMAAAPAVASRLAAVGSFAALRVRLLGESGDVRGARAAARAFTDRLGLLAQGNREYSGLGPYLWVVGLAGDSLDSAGRRWADQQLRTGMTASIVWTQAWALPATTPEAAQAAVGALASDPRLRPPAPGYGAAAVFPADYAAGHAYLLAGRAAQAAPFLRRAAAACLPFDFPFEHVLAALDLGQALEQAGDTQGACEAYGRVLTQWGHATPRSVSADAARAGVKRLHCTQ